MSDELGELRKFDLNLLIVFEAIYSAGNISRAARVLGQSQPTISNALSRLRDLLDDQLFVRTGSGVEPTSKATAMIGPVRVALDAIGNAVAEKAEFDPARDRRHFRMVLLDQLEPIIMPPILNAVAGSDTISFETFHIWNMPLKDSLCDNSLDLVLSTFIGDSDELECEAIGEIEVVMISRRDHPSIAGPLTMAEFETLPFAALPLQLRAMSFVDEVLQRHRIERHIAYTLNKVWSFPAMVSQTGMVGLVASDFARYAATVFPIDIHPLPFEVPKQKMFATWKKSRGTDQGLAWLRDEVRKAYR